MTFQRDRPSDIRGAYRFITNDVPDRALTKTVDSVKRSNLERNKGYQ